MQAIARIQLCVLPFCINHQQLCTIICLLTSCTAYSSNLTFVVVRLIARSTTSWTLTRICAFLRIALVAAVAASHLWIFLPPGALPLLNINTHRQNRMCCHKPMQSRRTTMHNTRTTPTQAEIDCNSASHFERKFAAPSSRHRCWHRPTPLTCSLD